jgi:hypothetical protein
VFLGRPTASPILASQMPGRALRGPAVGGTEDAYIVALREDWCRLPHGLDLAGFLPGIVAEAAPDAPPRHSRPPVPPPTWDQLEATAPRVRAILATGSTSSTESMHQAWYVLGHPDPTRGAGAAVAVYEHQQSCWEAAIVRLEQLSDAGLAELSAEKLRTDLFAACEAPLPTPRDLERLLAHFRAGPGRPVRYSREDRRACEPRTLAALIVGDDLGERDRSELVEKRYTPLARALYPTMRDYRAAVDDAAYQLQHPDEAAWTEPVDPVFEPTPVGRRPDPGA